MIPVSEYNPELYGDDQPVVHLKAVSGNEYRALYDDDAGYFFADYVIQMRDINTLADGIPGPVREPLDTLEIWVHPGNETSIRDIINHPEIDRVDQSLGSEVAGYLSSFITIDEHAVNDDLTGLVKSIKIDVNYDGRRGAQTSVFYYHDVPFLVTSCAGRELGDLVRSWVVDSDVAHKVVRALTSEQKIAETCRGTVVNLAYCDNKPVQLGDTFYGNRD